MGWNGVGLLIEVQGKMDAEQYCGILDEGVVESLKSWICLRVSDTFNRTMTPNTHPGKQHSGFLKMTSKYWSGLPNPLT